MMFLYQLNFAINKLMDPPIVETTDTLKLNRIEPPMMTVCPVNQESQDVFKIKEEKRIECTEEPILGAFKT